MCVDMCAGMCTASAPSCSSARDGSQTAARTRLCAGSAHDSCTGAAVDWLGSMATVGWLGSSINRTRLISCTATVLPLQPLTQRTDASPSAAAAVALARAAVCTGSLRLVQMLTAAPARASTSATSSQDCVQALSTVLGWLQLALAKPSSCSSGKRSTSPDACVYTCGSTGVKTCVETGMCVP